MRESLSLTAQQLLRRFDYPSGLRGTSSVVPFSTHVMGDVCGRAYQHARCIR